MADEQEEHLSIQAYVSRNYDAHVRLAMALLSAEKGNVQTVHLLLISLQRLGRTDMVEQIGAHALSSITRDDPWNHLLIQMTMGQINPSQVLDRARNKEQRCEALYYAGAHFHTEGRKDAASQEFAAASSLDVECLERRLALIECVAEQVDHLNKTARRFYEDGNLQGAITSLGQALHVAEEHYMGEEHPYVTTALNNLAFFLTTRGDFQTARPLREKVLLINQRVLGCEHPEVASNLNDLGYLFSEMGDYVAARSCYEQALGIRRKVLRPDHLDTTSCLNNLGMLLKVTGNLEAAKPCLEEALKIRKKNLGDEHPSTATSYNSLGGLLLARGDLVGARPYLERALEIRKKLLGLDNADTADSFNETGYLYSAMGDVVGARRYYEQSIEINQKVLGPTHHKTATSLNNLGYLLQVMGNPAEARLYLERGLQIRQGALGLDHPDTAQSYNNLGSVLQILGDFAGAQHCFEQALQTRRRLLGIEHADTASTLTNLAALLHARGEWEAAKQYSEQALQICRKVLGPEHRYTGLCLNNLATGMVALDQPTVALTLMQQAMAVENRIIGQILSIGSEEQRAGYLQSIQHNTASLLSLVWQHMAGSQPGVQAAFTQMLRRKALGAEALATQRDAVLGGRYPNLRHQLHQLTQLRGHIARKMLDGPDPAQAWSAHQQILDQCIADKNRLEAKLTHQIPDMNLEERLREADPPVVALLLPEKVTLVEIVRFHVFDFKAVAARAESKVKPARYLAFVLHAGESDNVQMIDLGEAEPIDRLIADFRAVVSKAPDNGSGRDVAVVVATKPVREASSSEGAQLRAAVFDPLRAALGNRTRLLIAPDGDLARLPFEVLPSGNGRLLIDEYQISYLSCGRDVLRLGTKSSRQPGSSLVVADPNFDLDGIGTSTSNPPVPGLSPEMRGSAVNIPARRSLELERGPVKLPPADRLPATRREGEAITKLLGDARLWVSDAALEGRLKKECRSPRILHMATHGHFLDDQERDPNKESRDLGVVGWQAGEGMGRLPAAGLENPLLRSWLVLAGFNTWLRKGQPAPDAEDGILTAEDVTGLDLLDTELVVLSACDTGLGEVHVGEGVFGLRRAFVLAGAKTLVMSLWKVPDLPTAILMERFYENLLGRRHLKCPLGRYESLREAQLHIRGVTVGQIRDRWLTPELIERMAAGNPDARRELQELSQQPYDSRPFTHPFYWGAFICQGEPGPMPVQRSATP